MSEHDPEGQELARQIARAARGAVPKPKRGPRERPLDEPTRVGDLLKGVMDDQGWTAEVNVHQLLARWPALVGPINAAHSTPESYSQTVLVVRADSTVWAASLRSIAPQLVAVLNEQLGQGTVTRIQVIGPQAPSWKKGPRSVPGRGPRDTYG